MCAYVCACMDGHWAYTDGQCTCEWAVWVGSVWMVGMCACVGSGHAGMNEQCACACVWVVWAGNRWVMDGACMCK